MATKIEERSADIGDLVIGAVVRLRSSTNRMTVHAIIAGADHGGSIECRWFDASGDLLVADFHPAELVIVKKASEL